MDQSLKQRLVGALVLASLAVIFLPLVFDGQQQRVDATEYEYPDQPAMTIQSLDFSSLEHEADQLSQEIGQIEAAKQKQASSESEVGPAADTVSVSDSGSSPIEDFIQKEREIDKAVQQSADNSVTLADAWIIQVGAFSSSNNADGLRDKLLAGGYKAYTRKVGGLFKVYVGPEIRRHRLEQQKSALEREYDVKTLILKYIP